MKPYSHTLKKLEEFYAPAYSRGHGPSKTVFKRLFNEVRDALPTLQIHVVARVRGPIIDKHVRGTLGGTKFEYRHQHNGDPEPERVAGCLVSAFAQARGLAHGADTRLVGEAIVQEVTPLLEQALLQVKNQDKATERAEENKKLLQEANRREAMEKLAFLMESWQYTEDEVLNAWRTAQVKAVMDS